jgi:low temperature requirement protein LtrA
LFRLAASSSHLRERKAGQHFAADFVELFFDLVFVLAVTQLSHGLLHSLNVDGVLSTTLLLVAVWWAWICTAWCTNWLDPSRGAVRTMLFAVMLAGLVMSASIPQAFETRDLSFAVAYAAIQIGRSAFMLWALHLHSQRHFHTFLRIFCWFLLTGCLWIAGALLDRELKYVVWTLALVLELGSPWFRYWVPGLGAARLEDWNVEGAHMAERCGLFVIVALGESILMTGAAFADLEWDPPTSAAFVTAFVGSVAMWMVYFNIGAKLGNKRITGAVVTGNLARSAYTFLHIPIVAGVVVTAVADELVLAHPVDHAEPSTALAIVSGPALFLLGNAAFKWTIDANTPISHFAALGSLAILATLGSIQSPLLLAAEATAILMATALWEWLAHRDVTTTTNAAEIYEDQ